MSVTPPSRTTFIVGSVHSPGLPRSGLVWPLGRTAEKFSTVRPVHDFRRLGRTAIRICTSLRLCRGLRGSLGGAETSLARRVPVGHVAPSCGVTAWARESLDETHLLTNVWSQQRYRSDDALSQVQLIASLLPASLSTLTSGSYRRSETNSQALLKPYPMPLSRSASSQPCRPCLLPPSKFYNLKPKSQLKKFLML